MALVTRNEPFSVEERNSDGFLWSIQEQEDSIGNIDKFLRSPRKLNKKMIRYYNFIFIEFEYQNS